MFPSLKNHHMAIGAAVLTFAYFYFVAKTSAGAQSIPVVNYPFNLGYNFGKSGTFSTTAPA